MSSSMKASLKLLPHALTPSGTGMESVKARRISPNEVIVIFKGEYGETVRVTMDAVTFMYVQNMTV